MIRIVFLCLIITAKLTLIGFGQQESQFINIVNNPYMLNPAAGGLADVVNFEITSRTQWLGYNGGPRTIMAIGNSQVKFGKSKENLLSEYNVRDKAFFKNPTVSTAKKKHIIGGKVLNDAIGPFSKTSVYGSYAFHLPLSKSINFGAGLGLGWTSFRINESRVNLFEEVDLAYAQFLGNSSAQNYLDANAGIVLYSERFFLGVSSSQLFQNKATFNSVLTESFYNRHFFLTLKYKLNLSDKLAIEPSLIGKMVKYSPLTIDGGAKFMYNDFTWLGVYYRSGNALVFQLGANIIKNIYISYGYEIATGKLKTAQNSSHEIQLGIYIGNNRNVDKEIKENKKENEVNE